jgi:hypothetical protein
MKAIGFACTALAAACVISIGVDAEAADVYQPIGVPLAPGCVSGYSWQKIGVRYQCVTPQPTCQYGYASNPVWNGSAWSYSCNAPPPPTCQYGYASNPVWNGSAWSYSCNPPPPPPPPPSNPGPTSCASTPNPGYTPQQSYAWVDATTYPNGANWPAVRQAQGVPANAEPYWAVYDLARGYSVYWSGPDYQTCSGGSNYYTAICWVDPSSGSVIKKLFGAISSIPQNGCGLQH